jgi:large subunit ribosomal protein L25
MKVPVMNAQMRETRGKGGARQTRRDGRVPVVMYAKSHAVSHVSIDAKEFDTMIKKQHRILLLEGEGLEKTMCLIHEVQRHPVSEKVIHADFLVVQEDEVVCTKLPIRLVGEAVGVKEGGQIRQLLHYMKVECKIADLPSFFDVDITERHADSTMLVRDLDVEGMEVLNDSHLAVMQMTKPRGDDEDEEESSTEGASTEEAPESTEAE